MLPKLLSLVFTLALLFTIHSSLLTSSAYALTESLSVCKVITDESGGFTNGSESPGVTFTIRFINTTTSQGPPYGTLPDTVFTTPLTLNTALFGSGSNNAACVTYANAVQTGCDNETGCGYYYQEEIISQSGETPPKYNDGFGDPDNPQLSDFNTYDPNLFDGNSGNDDSRTRFSDGHIVINDDDSETNTIFVTLNGSPSPEPTQKDCENPVFTDKLTKNVLEPLTQTFEPAQGLAGTSVTPQDFEIEVDFSKLQAIFGKPNSDYLESRFQDQDHRESNILGLSSSDFNSYHGPGQKAAPLYMIDELKIKYVAYINQKREIEEAANTYSDINGNDPRTVLEMIDDPQYDDVPNPPSHGGDQATWLGTWGRYWPKIPTTVNEYTYGRLDFLPVSGQSNIDVAEAGTSCPLPKRMIYFTLPEYFRTTSIANQLNQIVVPYAAQSSIPVDEDLLATSNSTQTVLSKIISACLKPFTDNPITKTLEKILKISFNTTLQNLALLNPIKDIYALPCISFLENDKQGTAPFCLLPANVPNVPFPPYSQETGLVDPLPFYLQPNHPSVDEPQLITADGEFCQDTKCTFIYKNPSIDIESTCDSTDGDGTNDCVNFDSCTPGSLPLTYSCTVNINLYPVFYIPWLAPIWNNTTYSLEDDQDYIYGTLQDTGKPGVYTMFKPGAVDPNIFPDPDNKNLPSESADKDSTPLDELKQRFFGATDCNKQFSRDVSLKPKALQEFLGIVAGC